VKYQDHLLIFGGMEASLGTPGEQKVSNIRIYAWGLTDIGKMRDDNEDSLLLDTDIGLFVVADGTSQHGRGGWLASRTAIETIQTFLHNYQRELSYYAKDYNDVARRRMYEIVRDAVQQACQHVYDLTQENEEQRKLASTVSLIFFVGTKAVIAHVGDTRIYMMRNNKLYQLTEDHTFVQDQVRLGIMTEDDIPKSPFKGILTRALGSHERVQVEIHSLDVLPGDRYMICSDGFYKYADKEIVKKFLTAAHGENIPRACIDYANAQGGTDDMTTLVLFVEGSLEDPHVQEVNQIIRALSNVPLFNRLDYSELVKLTNICFLNNYAPNDVIFHQGNMGDGLYVTLEGTVKIVRDNVELISLEPGSHFGEISLLDKLPRSATVIAETPCKLMTIARKSFMDLIKQNPNLGLKLLWNMNLEFAKRLRTSTTKITGLAKGIHID